MSPFSAHLRQLRERGNLKQKELALKLGYEPSYLSALERSEKGPPRREFLDSLVKALELSEAEQKALNEAVSASRRQITLPSSAAEMEYVFIRELEPMLGRLRPEQIYLMRLALSLPESVRVPDMPL